MAGDDSHHTPAQVRTAFGRAHDILVDLRAHGVATAWPTSPPHAKSSFTSAGSGASYSVDGDKPMPRAPDAAAEGKVYFNEFDAFAAQWLHNLWPVAVVDARDVALVRADDVTGLRCHFFAGIGGWEYALQLAGWPENRQVWTGSLPCQPFSAAGKQEGFADERHLWPVFRDLITECRPPTIFGEQVASPLGREWLAGVRADLEILGYVVGAADLCAASVGAPHIRQRLYWVADANSERDADARPRATSQAASGNENTAQERKWVRPNAWERYDVIPCLDGKSRRVEPSIQPLAHGIPARVGRLRAYGNAIVPQVAATFIRAFLAL